MEVGNGRLARRNTQINITKHTMLKWIDLDLYSLRARLQPCLLVLLPAALAVLAWIPIDELKFGVIWSILGIAGFTFLLAQVGRDRGKQIEPALWVSWGGKPTTQLLRHANTRNRATLERYHAALARVLGRQLPTEEAERNAPVEADELYDAAVTVLRNNTRDAKRYPLVFRENVNYGFRRNLYAMRCVGLFIAALAVIASGSSAVILTNAGGISPFAWTCTAINALLLALWIFRFNSTWVRLPAFAYAERLLETCEGIGVNSGK